MLVALLQQQPPPAVDEDHAGEATAPATLDACAWGQVAQRPSRADPRHLECRRPSPLSSPPRARRTPGRRAGARTRAAGDRWVTGFALGSLSHRALRRDAPALATLTVAGVSLTADGAASTPRRAHGAAGARGRARGPAHGAAAQQLQQRPRRLRRGARAPAALDADANRRGRATVAALVEAEGGTASTSTSSWSARATPPGSSPRRALQERLPAEATVTIDISASTSLAGYRDRGYDLAGLGDGRRLDRADGLRPARPHLVRTPARSAPSPGSATRSRALLKKVPADKIDLGVAGYGYTWPQAGTGRTVTAPAAPARWRARPASRPCGTPPRRVVGPAADGTVRLVVGRALLPAAGEARPRAGPARRGVWRLGSADPL